MISVLILLVLRDWILILALVLVSILLVSGLNLVPCTVLVPILPVSGLNLVPRTGSCLDSPCIGTESYSLHWFLSRFFLYRDSILFLAPVLVSILPVSRLNLTPCTGSRLYSSCIGTQSYSLHWFLSRFLKNRDWILFLALVSVPIPQESRLDLVPSTDFCPHSSRIETGSYSLH